MFRLAVASFSLTQYCPHTLLFRHLLIHFCRSYISSCLTVTSGCIFSSPLILCSLHCLLATDYEKSTTANNVGLVTLQNCSLWSNKSDKVIFVLFAYVHFNVTGPCWCGWLHEIIKWAVAFFLVTQWWWGRVSSSTWRWHQETGNDLLCDCCHQGWSCWMQTLRHFWCHSCKKCNAVSHIRSLLTRSEGCEWSVCQTSFCSPLVLFLDLFLNHVTVSFGLHNDNIFWCVWLGETG